MGTMISTPQGGPEQAQDEGAYGPQAMLGGSPQQQPVQDQAAQLQQIVGVVGQMEQELLSLSRAFPIATPAIRGAIENIRMALQQIVSNPNQPEPPAPRVLA